jgi:indoleamine 2,3-dioxygenase
VAIEARGAPLIPLMLEAMAAVRINDANTVTTSLQLFAERIDELGTLLNRMYEHCDPHVFYHRIRPFLAGSKNMADAGLPNGVIYEDNSGSSEYRQFGGGSNAQSSLIQFFDIVLGVTHRPTGHGPSATTPESNNFILDMRSYMPGPHARFLNDLSLTANIRPFVLENPNNRPLSLAYDAALAMLRALRDKHITMVSRYIIVKSRESRSHERGHSPRQAPPQKINIATSTASKMRGTGGTALIPFLKQARDETGEPAIDAWAQRLLGDRPVSAKRASSVSSGWGSGFGTGGPFATGVGGRKDSDENTNTGTKIVGLASTWGLDEGEGGICHW